MTDRNLSRAAQAVLDAYGSSPLLNDHVLDHRHCLAAALRAAAEYSCEKQDTSPETSYEQGYLNALERVYKRMNVIATELEGGND